MRVPINLASQPFRHDRAMLIGSGILAAILVGTLVMLISLTRIDQKNKIESMKQLAVEQKRIAMLQREQSAIDRDLHQPKNEAVLERSVLLNDLLRRKGISWSRIFADLEKVVPYNVQVLAIRPQLDAKNRVYLQMIVGADQTSQLTNFVQKLEASDLFGATMVTDTHPPSQTDPLYRYTVYVTYAQKL
ncbi:MAG TPA: hypothetical protein VGL72_29015 [Bryobacteraceae bacterium]|jgi:type IV pilus assembly protein PilN